MFSFSASDHSSGDSDSTSPPHLSLVRDSHTPVGSPLDPYDQDTVTSIRAGDKAVFDTLYLSTYDALITFATGYLHSGAAAEDIIQDVFLAIWRTRETWTPVGSIRAYLFAAVRNRALKHIRHTRIADASLASEDLRATSAVPVRPDDATEAEDRIARIRRTIETLPERHATALLLRWHRGLTYPEIATVLGVSPQAARTLVLRVQERLKTLLRDDR